MPSNEQREFEQVGRRSEVSSVRLLRVATALSHALTVDEVVAVVMEEAFSALGSAQGAVGLLSRDGTHLELSLVGKDQEPALRYTRQPLEMASPLTEALRRQEAVFHGSRDEIVTCYPALRDDAEMNDVRSLCRYPSLPRADR